ncbi:MAG TPA: hypothetical protein VFJ67_04800, partial [Thermodesulfobacteriota bacterium]|nr:hypothetical protein [Thermodesulfobacteriota bacterium]
MRREQIIEFLNFDDLVNRHPKDEPYVVLIGYESFQPTEYEEVALYSHSVHFNSLMISTDSKERALNEIDYHLVFASEGGYFEQAPSGEMIYNLNESWDYVDGLTVEPLILDRHWPGLGIQFYEPTQRMILYLGALNKNGDWINPYTEDVIIRSMQKNELLNEVRHSINRIEIKVDYLKDYLAARKSGLLIAKYSSRVLMFQSTDQIPILDSSKEVPHGRWNYHYVNEDSKSPKELWAEAELRQKFWIDPLPEPRHEGAHPRGEFVGGVKFTLQDGTKEEYDV